MRFGTVLALVCCICGSLRAQDLAGDLTLHGLLVDGEEWQLLSNGLGFADGPCSDSEGNFYFSDMKAPAISRIALDGSITKIAEEPASGLKFGPDGRLYACQGSKKRIIAIDPVSGKIDVVAEGVQPNDLVITRSGWLYFTDTGKKQIICIHLASGDMSMADEGITAPNGITLSPDQGTLAVSDWGGAHVWTFRVRADGKLDSKASYMTMRLPINPQGEFRFNEPPPLQNGSRGDGMISDTAGRYYVATALGVQVFDPIGRICGVIPVPQKEELLTSCTLAGPERAYLYVTNGDKIYRRKVQAVGSFFPAPAEKPGAL
jgi:enterochelin esterase family protein